MDSHRSMLEGWVHLGCNTASGLVLTSTVAVADLVQGVTLVGQNLHEASTQTG